MPYTAYGKTDTPITARIQGPLTIQIAPNSLKKQTVITYQLPTASYVQLVISDIQGRPIKTLINHIFQEKGQQKVDFFGK